MRKVSPRTQRGFEFVDKRSESRDRVYSVMTERAQSSKGFNTPRLAAESHRRTEGLRWRVQGLPCGIDTIYQIFCLNDVVHMMIKRATFESRLRALCESWRAWREKFKN